MKSENRLLQFPSHFDGIFNSKPVLCVVLQPCYTQEQVARGLAKLFNVSHEGKHVGWFLIKEYRYTIWSLLSDWTINDKQSYYKPVEFCPDLVRFRERSFPDRMRIVPLRQKSSSDCGWGRYGQRESAEISCETKSAKVLLNYTGRFFPCLN